MDAIFKEYGDYIIAALTIGFIIWCVSGILGFFDPLPSNGTGTGMFGKLVCLWLNRTM
jgi:hypothetical protein